MADEEQSQPQLWRRRQWCSLKRNAGNLKRNGDESTGEGSGDTNGLTTTEVATMNVGGDDPRQQSDKGTRSQEPQGAKEAVQQWPQRWGENGDGGATNAEVEVKKKDRVKKTIRESGGIVPEMLYYLCSSTNSVVRSTNAQLLHRFCKKARSFGLFSLYITVATRPFGQLLTRSLKQSRQYCL
ncbi:hypothetical protein V8G54_029828 [Vigna mungo]|uniref:Uncharacterized protein n=1 Tax=Vigna mungo TaxID=3915 RepID=A0AAQ3RLU4_VIGMU